MLRQFWMNLVNGCICWGLKRFQQLRKCCMFANSFPATAASVTWQLRFFFYFARNIAYLFCGKLSLSHSLSLSLLVCVFLLRNGQRHLPGQDVPEHGRWQWRQRPSSRCNFFISLFVLFCLLCCRHLRNWRSCWHAITFVLPSRRSSSRIREWLRILHTIILCRNCWRNPAPEVSAFQNAKTTSTKLKASRKVKRKMENKKKLN